MGYVFVGIGGMLGAVLRYTLGIWIGAQTGSAFPYPTLLINLVGCFILAFFYTITVSRLPVHPHFRAAFGSGFIGSFTTFSTFSYETLALLYARRYDIAITYAVISVAGGYVLAYFGARLGLGERLSKTRERKDG